ncbi:MAG: hypothetical protein H7X92_03490 [Chitinophagales bacterium]|nr:hypothetical protein [Hyphomicrobiales bacterium]
MAEPLDVILPILQRIQTDVSEMKREEREHRADTNAMGERLDAISECITYQMGLTASHSVDMESIREEIIGHQKATGRA